MPEQRVAAAISGRESFNVIHLGTMLKIDAFVSRDRPHDRQAFGRIRLAPITSSVSVPVSSPEDTVLAKLEWFRRGGELSERQWTDVTGLLRVATHLDQAYLSVGARTLGVDDLLIRALDEARLPGDTR